MKNRFVSLINRNNRRVVHPPPWNRFISNIFSGRLENPIGEKYVSQSMLDHPWFLRWFFSYAQQNCAAIQRIESNSPIYLFIFFFFREQMKSFARIFITLDRISRELSHFLRSCLFQDPSTHPLPARFLRHLVSWTNTGVSIDAFAIRIEAPSPGRYLMKRQSHLRIAISNSARQRRTRGRVGGRRQRSRSAVTR